VQSPAIPAIFQPRIAKKLTRLTSVRVIVICSDHRFLWQDSFKGVDYASTLPVSILHNLGPKKGSCPALFLSVSVPYIHFDPLFVQTKVSQTRVDKNLQGILIKVVAEP